MPPHRVLACQNCSRELKVSVIDLLPMPSGSVSVDCRYCGHTNRVSYAISLSLWVGASVLSFLAALIFDGLFPRLGAWIVIPVFGGMFMLNWLFLRMYLRYSRSPFTESRRRP